MVAKTFNYLPCGIIKAICSQWCRTALPLSPHKILIQAAVWRSCESKLLCWTFSDHPCSLLAFRSCVRAPSWASPNHQTAREIDFSQREKTDCVVLLFLHFLYWCQRKPKSARSSLAGDEWEKLHLCLQLSRLNSTQTLSLSLAHTHTRITVTHPSEERSNSSLICSLNLYCCLLSLMAPSAH